MDWYDEVRGRLQKKNQILFVKDCAFLQELNSFLRIQNHRTVVLWAFDLAEESIEVLAQNYPMEKRPQEALDAARDWAAGRIKMHEAQRKILDCHAFAKEIDCRADIAACHAVGQACAVVHTAGHAMGYPIYDLSSIVYREGSDHCTEAVERRRETYIDRLLYRSVHQEDRQNRWAEFMLR